MHKVRTRIPHYTLLILLSCCLGCGNKTQVSETEDIQNEFQSYKIDLHGDKIPFVDLIESIEITQLEETEESLLRYVGQVEFYEDKMIIPASNNDGTIYIYSQNGEYISKFNRKGNGPEEYSKWTDIWLEDNLICIYVPGKSINRYDLEGNFISQETLDEYANHIYPYKSGYVIDKHLLYTQDSLKYTIVTVDDRMKIDQKFLPFKKVPGFRSAQFRNSFSKIDDDLLYLPAMSDTVFRLTEDSVEPFIHYDFQDDWYFKSGVNVEPNFYEKSSRNKQVWFVLNYVGEQLIYLYTTLGPRMSYSFLVDRATNQSVSIELTTTTGEFLDLSWLGWQEDQFIVALMPPQITDLVEQLDQAQYSFTKGTNLEEIEISENPVLVWVTLKRSNQW